MISKATTLILSALLLSIFTFSLYADQPGKPKLLREGTLIQAVEGKLIKEKNDKWFFKFNADVNDLRNTIKAGTGIELLPSAALEEMTSIAKVAPVASFKLWAKVTLYKDSNYLFGIYSMPLSEPNIVPEPVEPTPQTPTTTTPTPTPAPPAATALDDPEDILSIPAEIKKRLNPKCVIRPTQLIKKPLTKQKYDSMLTDRTGFIVETDPNQYEFVFDALGRNIEKISVKLLPCQMLQIATERQAQASDPIRFKVAGTVTQCENEYYLLLQRAAQTYSHGNFSN